MSKPELTDEELRDKYENQITELNQEIEWQKQYTIQFLADYERLEKMVDVMREALNFYGLGGHPAMDMWQHETLGYFTGKRAQEALAKVERIEND